MAFNEKKLTLVAHGSGNQLFQYVTEDTLATVAASGYANTETMRKGDAVMVSAGLGSSGDPELGFYMVSAVTDGVATLVPVTAKEQTAEAAS